MCLVPVRNRRDTWMQEMEARQRNIVFPDTVQNAGGFWRGLRDSQLNLAQAIGLLILLLFYVLTFTILVYMSWPKGPGAFWEKLIYGYGLYFLLSLPVVIFFVLLARGARRYK
jgi:hypothetical protein